MIGLGLVSGCAVIGPYVINAYCAEAFTNVLLLSPHWPYVVAHWTGIPGTASPVTLMVNRV